MKIGSPKRNRARRAGKRNRHNRQPAYRLVGCPTYHLPLTTYHVPLTPYKPRKSRQSNLQKCAPSWAELGGVEPPQLSSLSPEINYVFFNLGFKKLQKSHQETSEVRICSFHRMGHHTPTEEGAGRACRPFQALNT